MPDWRYTNEGECDYVPNTMDYDLSLPPVHQHKDGTWWFLDECMSGERGPFATQEECQTDCNAYGDSL